MKNIILLILLVNVTSVGYTASNKTINLSDLNANDINIDSIKPERKKVDLISTKQIKLGSSCVDQNGVQHTADTKDYAKCISNTKNEKEANFNLKL